ncbi:hypothetical protein L7F22_059028 [Adiantum nelumboides]|nr:hypothetical protein [Adiantum nelumboides]
MKALHAEGPLCMHFESVYTRTSSILHMMGLKEDAMEESLDLMDTADDNDDADEDRRIAKAGKQQEEEAGNVCAAMASIMSGLSVRVHLAGAIPRGLSVLTTSEKKPVHGQVARLRKEDQQLMEDVCTDACGCGCFCSIGNAICGGGTGAGGRSTSPCRRRLLHHLVANNQENYRGTPLLPHFDNAFGHSGGDNIDVQHHSSGSGSSGGVASNVSTPRASTPSPLGIRTRSWSTAAADAAWDSAASIARTVSSSF